MRQILVSPAISNNTRHSYRFILRKEPNDKMKSTLHIQRNFDNKGDWDGVPSGWYVGTLLNVEGFSGNNENSDKLYIDGGQDWYVTGAREAIAEIKTILEVPLLEIS